MKTKYLNIIKIIQSFNIHISQINYSIANILDDLNCIKNGTDNEINLLLFTTKEIIDKDLEAKIMSNNLSNDELLQHIFDLLDSIDSKLEDTETKIRYIQEDIEAIKNRSCD